MEKFYNYNRFLRIKNILQVLAICLFFCCQTFSSSAQCPTNIDFEEGDFSGWQCYVGTFSNGNLVLNPSAPTPGRHDMLSAIPGNGIDAYGLFPQNCPNGSNHSIKLGNSQANGMAERVSYTFTIPPTENQFNLIYNYAIVLNDGGHPANIQPRLTIEVKNLTDNTISPCSSFDIAISAGGLPGFLLSGTLGPNNSQVWYKNWSANTINLDGNAGKTIQISFTTTDCGQTVHFGYAYIDINSECSSSFIGAVFCPDDAFINVTAPFGYQTYAWWDATFTTPLGNTQTINFTPPPAPGTIIKVVLTPYPGYGCSDTLTAQLLDTLTIQSQAGPDRLSCNNAPVQLGALPKPGYVYSWSPVTGLSNPNISNPIATPSVTTQYVVTTSHEGGGCISTDTVIVSAAVIDNTIQLIGPPALCPNTSQTTMLKVLPADSIQWYRNGLAIPGANQTQYTVLQSGAYYATLFSFVGCSLSTATQNITVYPEPVAGFTVNSLDQCFRDHQYIFTNTSSVSSGTLQYDWNLGDATTATTANVTHSYALPGTYTVQLIVTTNNGCKDTSSFTVHVYPTPVAGFTINAPDQCFKDHQYIFTNTSSVSSGTLQYNWDLGDATTATTANVTHSYTLPGTYNVQLIVTTNNGCKDTSSITVNVYASPVAAFAVNTAEQCFKNNQFVFSNSSSVSSGTLQYNWDMGNGTLFTSKDVTYAYPLPGNYTVKLLITTDKGCKDSSLFNVTVYSSPVAGFTINNPHQCFNNNQFIYTNTTTTYSGTLQYYWDLGDGTNAFTKDVTHSYAQPGVYKVSMLTTGVPGGCMDSSSFTIDVYPYPLADFYVPPATCVDLELPVINKTINNTTAVLDYLWDFGNGNTSTLRHPFYSYPAAGNYTIKLTVDIAQCPQVKSTRQLDVYIEGKIPGITYPEKNAIFNYPEALQARNIGTSVLWTPGISLDNRFSYSPTFKGINPQLYTIQLKTPNGCITVDTQMVKTTRKIEIYVPTAFTPGSSTGLNDYLRPTLMGFTKVNYFRIYNRWGKLIFQMQSDRPGWDGKINGKLQEMQTFVWMIEAVDVDGNVHRQQGTTVLLH